MNYISRFVNDLIKIFQSRDIKNPEPLIDLVDLHPDSNTEITLHLLPGNQFNEGRVKCIVNGIHYPPDKPHISFYNSWSAKDVMFTSPGLTNAVIYRQSDAIRIKIEVVMDNLLSKVYSGEVNRAHRQVRATSGALADALMTSITNDGHVIITLVNGVITIDRHPFTTDRLLQEWSPDGTKHTVSHPHTTSALDTGKFPKALLDEIMNRLEHLEREFAVLAAERKYNRRAGDDP